MKIQLIHPPLGNFRTNSRSGSYQPLGLLSIATFLTNNLPNLDIEILDGEIVTLNNIIGRINAEIIGINTNTINYPVAIEIATYAKSKGAKVVLGGVYASAMCEKILENRKDIIDTIVVGYGEKPMLDIINGSKKRIIYNSNPPFNDISLPDRRFLNMDDYVYVFRKNHSIWNYNSTNIFTNVGCYWREFKEGGCIFCSRSGVTTMFKDPELIWKEVRTLVENYNINYIIDFSDTILQNYNWLKKLLDAKPADINPFWHVFARADEITGEKIQLLKKLNCIHVFTGLESGDPEIYRHVCKGGGSPDENLRAVKLLKKNNIMITPSYVTGLPGETEKSLYNTFNYAKRVKDIIGFEEIFCCELIPFPGSVSFTMLKNKVNIPSDIIEVEYLKRIWSESFCSVYYPIISDYTKKILDLGLYTITIKS